MPFRSATRSRGLYNPDSETPFKLSRSKLELFTNCPRCFYFDRRLGVGRPQIPAFTLNSAVDTLLKKEFDIHRARGQAHPLMTEYKVNAVPFVHEDLDKWRQNFVGVQYLHEPTNFIITGAVDDVWRSDNGELFVVDYKATSTLREISLEDEYKQGYKRQLEIYQWLLRKNGFDVSDTGYFVYVNGKTDRKAFDGKLDFDIQLISYKGDSRWVEKTILDAWNCLQGDKIPNKTETCEYCGYVEAMSKELK
ncbi:MAG: PD-(D/E)XK nuclease family protein [bacterium]|nr:PD-(D/E)XK nuclease family protein [bacterium]